MNVIFNQYLRMTYKKQLDKVHKYLKSNKDVNIKIFCQSINFSLDDTNDIIREFKNEKFIHETEKDSGIYNLTRRGKLFNGYICNDIIKYTKAVLNFVLSLFIAVGAASSIFLVFREKKEITPKSNQVILVVDSSFVSDLNLKSKSKNELITSREKAYISSVNRNKEAN